MLLQLHIENVAVIECADIEFTTGFSSLTGETGAGKSILIDSINMLLGERASREIIRTGCDKAFVSASFDVSSAGDEFTALCGEYGVESEDGTLLLSREIHADGRSVSRINARQCTASVLRDVGKFLVNIHGQQDSAFLLNPQKHLSYLDAYAADEALLSSYRTVYADVTSLRKEISSIRTDEQEKARRMDMLTYQIKEIEDAAIRPGEKEELLGRRKMLMNAEKIADVLCAAYETLRGGHSDVYDSLNEVSRSVGGIAPISQELSALYDRVQSVCDAAYDLSETVRDLRDSMDFDQRELDDIGERLDTINTVMRKYGKTEEDVLSFLDKARAELDDISLSDKKCDLLKKELAEKEVLLKRHADELTAVRRRAAEGLDEKIAAELHFLEMPDACFITDIRPCEYGRNGADDVQFLLTVNVGEEPRPLSKIASGGELSRIMLGIRQVLSMSDHVGTLIFDEIDTGVSGRAAQKIAVKMREMSSTRQVFAVTHLAQIASASLHQYLIEKHSDGIRTYTEVRPLDGQARVREIGRLLGGGDLTETVLKAAEEMIRKANP